jgi:hypothetical protein
MDSVKSVRTPSPDKISKWSNALESLDLHNGFAPELIYFVHMSFITGLFRQIDKASEGEADPVFDEPEVEEELEDLKL